jgi:hypothetical protein
MMIPAIPTQLQILVGILLMLVGISFFYKGWQATVKGRMSYWSGFLPFTLISPFILHLPASKNSLVKVTEGLWIHMLMGPLFFIAGILCLGAGADYAGLPGTNTVNYIIAGGKSGRPAAVTFDRQRGYRFPILARAGETLGKLFGQELGMKNEDRLYDQNQGSYNDATNNAS